MGKYIINGGKKLYGTVDIQGSKNSAVAILIATLVTDGDTVISNLPDITDVDNCLKILSYYGCAVKRESRVCVKINTDNIRNRTLPCNLIKKIRASNYLIGALLSRFGACELPESGGCNFGSRPVDLHIGAMTALGASVKGGGKFLECRSGLIANNIVFPFKTVGGTVNAIIAAVKARGTTVIENAAREPHIVDLANFLNACGADIVGAGTDIIKIKGVRKLSGVTYAIIPDMIEAGTYMMAAAATGSRLTVANVIPKHLESITAKLEEMGVDIEEHDESITVSAQGRLERVNVKTLPYPGFPTDMNPQMCVLLCLASGTSILTEGVWDGRFKYTEEVIRMGANISVDGRTAVVQGVEALKSANVKAVDLRAGAAMVIAALAANGRTVISDIHHIERGYENIVEKLRQVGADIMRVSLPESNQLAGVS